MVDDLLLQRGPKRPVQGQPPPAVHAAPGRSRFRNQIRRREAIRGIGRGGLARRQEGRECPCARRGEVIAQSCPMLAYPVRRQDMKPSVAIPVVILVLLGLVGYQYVSAELEKKRVAAERL